MTTPQRRSRFLLANLPWQEAGRYGVRAGSRWPHKRSGQEGGYLPFPFFLAYATALLQKHARNASLIDAIAEKMSAEQFLARISDECPDYLVAETSVPSFDHDMALLKKISAAGVAVILCGPHAEIYRTEFLESHPFVSFVLCGEYEMTLLELAVSLDEGGDLSSVRGLIFRHESRVVKNPKREPFDIGLLPWPHRETLPMQRYLDAPGGMPVPSVQMMASRGCPFRCSFCLWPQVMYQGAHYRPRAVRDVADEMEHLVREKGFKSVYFDDDTFNIGKERMLRLCDEFKQRGLDKVPWAIMARPDLMDEEILKNMKGAGLWAVKYGVESVSPDLASGAGKMMDLSKAKGMIRLTNALGIKTHLTFTFGLPGETRKTIEGTIRLARELDPFSLQFSIATPFPGTAFFDELEKKKKILTRDWSCYDGHHRCVFAPDHLSASDLEEAKDRAYRSWIVHQRRRRGLRDHVKVFLGSLRKDGVRRTLVKTARYWERDLP